MNQIGHFKVLEVYIPRVICPRGYMSRVSVQWVGNRGVFSLGVGVWVVHVRGRFVVTIKLICLVEVQDLNV